MTHAYMVPCHFEQGRVTGLTNATGWLMRARRHRTSNENTPNSDSKGENKRHTQSPFDYVPFSWPLPDAILSALHSANARAMPSIRPNRTVCFRRSLNAIRFPFIVDSRGPPRLGGREV